MNVKLVTACVCISALLAPVGVYSADTSSKSDTPSASTKESPKEVISDTVITTKIKADFVKDKQVSATSIKVDTDKGVVTLSGTAKSQAEVDKALALARDTKGVVSVKNNIQLTSAK